MLRFRNRAAKSIVCGRPFHVQQLESRLLLSTLPPGFAETQLASQLVSPTAMTVAPDGRVFVALQGGDVRIVQNGTLLPTPFLSIATSYGDASQGLFGITLDPNFESNGYVYVDYTIGGSPAFQRISRFTANDNVAIAGSEDVLFQVGPQTPAGHIGGGLEFGGDGKLYFTYGDNQQPNLATLATQLNNFYGKMIRINPDGTIPTDNPFYNQTTGDYRAIWALGLRNAYSFSVQPATGLTYIADVGQASWEEIDQGIAGANYGWPTSEGPTVLAGQTAPVYAYPHTGSTTGAYAVISGPFYNPAVDQFPSQYVGQYFFGDWGSGLIQTLDPANPTTAQTFATGAFDTVALSVGPDGSLYYLTRGDNNYGLDSTDGQLFQVQYTGLQSPSIAIQPANVVAADGSSPTFSFETNGTGPFTYQWQSGDVDIPGATSATYTLNDVNESENGQSFDVVVTNAFGMATSAAASLSIIPHAPPPVSLASPAVRSFYTAGKALAFSATATDPAFGTLPGSDFAWTISFYHSTSVSTVMTLGGATSGSFAVPTSAQDDADVYYRVSLTVTDSDGLSTSAFQDVFPNTSIEMLASNVPGAQLMLDGNTVATPYTFMSVTGTTHTISAAAQTVGGTAYKFASWSDSGAASHTISTPSAGTTFTANLSSGTVSSLPSPWTQSDVGAVSKAGSAAYNGTAFTVSGAGDFVASADTLHFVDQPLSGNGSIIARVASQTNTNAWAKAGIMLRQSTAAGSTYVALVLTPGHGVEMLARKSAGATPVAVHTTAGAAPTWMKLSRSGNTFTAFTSSDGVTWKTFGSVSVTMSTTVDEGLVVASNTTGLSTAVFDHVSATSTVTPAQTILAATADSYVRDGSYANTNFGSSAQLQVKAGSAGYNRYTLLTFNLASITTVSSAMLTLFGDLSDSSNSSITTSVYAVTGMWNESTVTYNTRPAVSATALESFAVSGTIGKTYTLNLTTWLQQQKAAGATAASLMLKNAAATSAYTILNSKESGSDVPQLIVTS